MSDFLLGLARRSAGLAASVQSRDLPPPPIVTAPTIDAAPALPAVPPPPAAPAPAGVIQREPLPQTIASPSATPAPAAVVPSPPQEPGAARADADVVIGREVVPPLVVAVVRSEPERHPQALPAAAAADVRVEHHTATRVVELVPTPIAVVSRREDNQPHREATVRHSAALVAADRLVQVRIGAIEIVGAPAPAPPAAALPAASAPARVNGFDDFSALRTYAPFHW